MPRARPRRRGAERVAAEPLPARLACVTENPTTSPSANPSVTPPAAPAQIDEIRAGYAFSGAALEFGAAVVDGAAYKDAPVKIPLAVLNRHGLVAGATGTGKTKTLQLMAEQLIEQGVPVFLADIKGDLSGMASPGEPNDKITARANDIGMTWAPARVGIASSRARASPGASAALLRTSAICAGASPAARAWASATKLLPRPESRTPTRVRPSRRSRRSRPSDARALTARNW